jgi:hypothetical protein
MEAPPLPPPVSVTGYADLSLHNTGFSDRFAGLAFVLRTRPRSRF